MKLDTIVVITYSNFTKKKLGGGAPVEFDGSYHQNIFFREGLQNLKYKLEVSIGYLTLSNFTKKIFMEAYSR
jgi:hypothetical protein